MPCMPERVSAIPADHTPSMQHAGKSSRATVALAARLSHYVSPTAPPRAGIP